MSHQEYLVEQAEVLLSYEPPFALIPIKLTVNDDGKLEKMPVMKWKEKPIPEKELMKKLRAKRGANGLAFDLRRSGLVIIDVDDYKDECNFDEWRSDTGYEMPITWMVKSGSGGTHFIFANPDNIQLRGNIAGVAAVDIKSAGIEIIPPSFVDRHQYDWLVGPDDLEEGPAPIPDWLIEECGKGEASGSGADNVTVALAMREPEENIDILEKLLEAPNYSVDYAQWLTIVMGLHFEFHETGFEVRARKALINWTKTRAEGCSDDDIEQVKKTWDNLPRGAEIQTPFVTIGSVYHFLDQFEKPPMEPEKAAELKDTLSDLKEASVEKAKSKIDDAVQLEPFSLSNAPLDPRPWVLGRDLIKGEVTALFGQGGCGKSSAVILQALSLATGRPLMGAQVYGKRKVWLWNGEDGKEELRRRITAAMQHYGITQEDIGDRLIIMTNSELPLNMAFETNQQEKAGPKTKVTVDAALRDWIIDKANEQGVDVIIFDPFINTHQLNENDNVHVNIVMTAFKQIARDGNLAVQLVHHVQKGSLRDEGKADNSADAARGATAFINAARIGLALQQMSVAEANIAEIDNPTQYVKLIDSKANLAERRSFSDVRWFKKESVNLGNATQMYPHGDDVAVIVPFTMTQSAQLRKLGQMQVVLETLKDEMEVMDSDDEDGPVAGFVFKHSSNTFWAGWKIAEALDLPIGEVTAEAKRSDQENMNREVIVHLLSEAVKGGYIKATEKRPKPSDRSPAPVYTVEHDALLNLERLKRTVATKKKG